MMKPSQEMIAAANRDFDGEGHRRSILAARRLREKFHPRRYRGTNPDHWARYRDVEICSALVNHYLYQ
jgi:hypothetical protein